MIHTGVFLPNYDNVKDYARLLDRESYRWNANMRSLRQKKMSKNSLAEANCVTAWLDNQYNPNPGKLEQAIQPTRLSDSRYKLWLNLLFTMVYFETIVSIIADRVDSVTHTVRRWTFRDFIYRSKWVAPLLYPQLNCVKIWCNWVVVYCIT